MFEKVEQSYFLVRKGDLAMKGNSDTTAEENVKTLQPAKPTYPWMETEARVVSCHFEFARMQAFALGIFTPSERFVISFSYHAHGKTYSDQYSSPVAVGQNETFKILYNPLAPRENNIAGEAYEMRAPMAAYGIVASIAMSLIFLFFVRGC